jgi:hypothetical protein
MKNFKKFLEEISIKGNPGIPGEADKNEPQYISDVDRRAQSRLGVRKDSPMSGYPLFGRIMPLLHKANSICRGKEKELEVVAEETIRNYYGSILEDVILDIKFVKNGNEVAEFMEECEQEQETKYKEVSDDQIKNEIHKRKIANAIAQGESKNTKRILNMSDVKESVRNIFGEQTEELYRLWNEITDIADKLDWIIPVQDKGRMMEEAPQGLAGACSVEWKPKEYKDEEEVQVEEEEETQSQEENEYTEFDVIVKARGIDFPMLLHESVKGIYELISAAGIPEDENVAKTVMLNTDTFADEAEDFRYGPEIAADLRDFINENPSVDDFPNMREHLFGKMMVMSADEFLSLMKGILMKSPEARRKVDSIISDIIKELKDFETGLALPNSFNDDDDDREEDTAIIPTEKETDVNVDYSKMSQRDIENLINDALDDNDIETVKYLSQYLKEGKEIYLKEIKRILG